MEAGKLGFGMMRLPVKENAPAEIDFEQLDPMVDAFMAAGYNYFDTSYVYHNGKSENAVRRAVVERYPREQFLVGTKFPTFALQSEDQIEPIFTEQLERLGVDYIDYYMLHNVQTVLYDGIDGKGGVMGATNIFDHLKGWKENGKAKHIGISFHSSAKLLDRILSEHPEIEFVQLAINYIDWDSEMVQARDCYETARKHGRQVIVMEPVKGGALAKLPEAAERLLKAEAPENSIASWAFRFLASLDGVITTLSGMSTMEQVQDNIRTMQQASPLSERDRAALEQAIRIYRGSAPIPPEVIEKYRGLTYHGVPATALIQAYSICQIQPNPCFSDDLNYPTNAMAEFSHLNLLGENAFPEETVLLPDGTDGTALLKQAEAWFQEHHF